MRINPQLSPSDLGAHRALLANKQATPATRPAAVDPVAPGRPNEPATPAGPLAGTTPYQTADFPTPPAPPTPPTNENPMVDYIMDFWGSDNQRADVNSDGTVDAADLAMFLSYGAADAAASDAENDPQLTLEGLLNDWGQTDSMYDLNEDGTVNADDLAELLSDPPAASDEPDEIASLIEAWGQPDSMYDVNGDGTVDAADLAQLLAGGGSPPAAAGADAGTIDPALANVPPAVTSAVMDMLGTTESGGIKITADAPSFIKKLDGDGDGMIKPNDLLSAVQHSIEAARKIDPDMDPGRIASQWMDALGAHRTPPADGGAGNASGRQRLDQLVEAIGRRFDRAGFSTTPPTNVHQLLDNLNLGSAERSYVLNGLKSMYPKGLGLNMVG